MATEITSLSVRIGANIQGYARGMAQVQRGVQQAETSFAGLNQTVRRVTAAVGGLAAGFAALKAVGIAKDAALASARFGTLGVVMEQVGRTAGYSSAQMGEFDRALRRTGISMTGSREALAQLVSAQVDLAESTKLARVAQDAAVIGGTNSSEAFARMVTGIQNANTITLRTIGLNVDFERSYQEIAKTLGKTVGDLTDAERSQARVNAVLQAGAGIAGSYEASMDSAGKVIGSMPRQIDDLRVRLGALFDETTKRGAFGLYNALSDLNGALERLGDDRVQSWGRTLADTVQVAANAGIALAAVMAGRVVVSLGAAAAASVRKAQASLVEARTQAAATKATLDGALAQLQMARAMDRGTGAMLRQRAAALQLQAAHTAHAAALARTTVAARAAAASMGVLRGAFALLGGWPGIIITGLGLLAFKFLEVRREAKRTADEIRQAITDSTAGFADLDKAATFKRLGTARKEVAALEAAVADLNATAAEESKEAGPTGYARGQATQETAAALASATRALEVARGEASALEKQYIRLAQAGGESFNNTRTALALTSENLAELTRRLKDAEDGLKKLEVDQALAPAGEALDRVNQSLAEQRALVVALRREMARYSTDISGIPVSMAGVGQSIQRGVKSQLLPSRLLGSAAGFDGDGRWVRGTGAASMRPSAAGQAQTLLDKWLSDPKITIEALEGSSEFRRTVETLKKENERRKAIDKAAGLTGGGSRAGDIGAALSGIGGMMGGRAGGAASGIGSAITGFISATNPLTQGLAIAGGAMTALNSIFDSGVSKIERVRESFDRLVSFMASKFELLDTTAQQQFGELQATLADKLKKGPLRDLLLGSSMGNTQDFIAATVKVLEAIRALPKMARDTLMGSAFGGLSEEQVMGFLSALKRLTDATDKAVSSMLGVPQGFKVALARFNATAAQMQVSSITGPTDTGGWMPGGTTTNSVTIEKVEIRAAEGVDVAKLWRDLQREIQRQAARGGATLGLST